jgi:hypothetical protein
MRWHANSAYAGKKGWRMPRSSLDVLAWLLVVGGGLLIVALVKSVLAAVVLAVVCGVLIGLPVWRAQKPEKPSEP